MSVALVIGKTWPEPRSSAAGKRVVDLIIWLQEGGHEVHFGSAAKRGEYTVDLEGLGVRAHEVQLNDSSFDQWVQELAPGIVLYDRYMTEEQFSWRVDQACPDVIRLLDTSDLHCLREARAQSLKSGEPVQYQNKTALREVASIWRCDQTLMISEKEIEILHSHYQVPPTLLSYLPLVVGEEELEISGSHSFGSRQHCMMIGNYFHEPNWDAVQWCLRDIWPLVRKELPGVELHLYGAYEPQKARDLAASCPGVIAKGRASEAREVLEQYRLSLAPLRIGAGQKGKVVDSWCAGTPCVVTPIAGESMDGGFPWGFVPSQDAAVFASQVAQLYSEENKWAQAQEYGTQMLKARFLRAPHFSHLNRMLEGLTQNLASHRQDHFTGQMFRHHALQSTKYFSKWIEQKNNKVQS